MDNAFAITHIVLSGAWAGVTLWQWRKAATRASWALFWATTGFTLLALVGFIYTRGVDWAEVLLTPAGVTLGAYIVILTFVFGASVYNSLVAPQATLGVVAGGTVIMTVLAVILTTLPFTYHPPVTTLTLTVPTETMLLSGEFTPAQMGVNATRWRITTPDGQPLTGALVELSLLPVGGGGLVYETVLSETAPGEYTAPVATLNRDGPWQVLLAVKREAQPPVYVTADLEIRADGVLYRTDAPTTFTLTALMWLNQYGSVFVVSGLFVMVFGLSVVVWRLWPLNPFSKLV